MKTRIMRYLNNPKYKPMWMIEIQRNKGERYEPLYNGSTPYYFNTDSEASRYLESIKNEFELHVKPQ